MEHLRRRCISGLDTDVQSISRLADALPKHWGGAAGTGAVSEQLQGKLRRQNTLLQILSSAGCLAPLPPGALRCAFCSESQ